VNNGPVQIVIFWIMTVCYTVGG